MEHKIENVSSSDPLAWLLNTIYSSPNDTVLFELRDMQSLLMINDVSPIKNALVETGKTKIQFPGRGRQTLNTINLEKINEFELVFFQHYLIPLEKQPKEMKKDNKPTVPAICLGKGAPTERDPENFYFYLEGDTGASFWDQMKLNEFSWFILDRRVKMETPLFREQYLLPERNTAEFNDASKSFFDRFTYCLNNENYDQAINMLKCLKHRHSENNFEIFLPFYRPKLKYAILNYPRCMELISHWDQCLEASGNFLRKEKMQECRKAMIKTWFSAAAMHDKTNIVKGILDTDFVGNLPTLTAQDFEETELTALVCQISNVEIMETLILSGIIDDKHSLDIIKNVDSTISVLGEITKYYYKAINSNDTIMQLSNLLHAVGYKNGLAFVAKLFCGLINSIPSYNQDANLDFIKNMMIVLSMICADNKNCVDKNIFSNIVGALLNIDFETVKNKSIFSDNKARREFIKKYFTGRVVALEAMASEEGVTQLQNALQNSDKSELIIPVATENDQIDQDIFFENVRIIALDLKQYETALQALKIIDLGDLDEDMLELLKHINKCIRSQKSKEEIKTVNTVVEKSEKKTINMGKLFQFFNRDITFDKLVKKLVAKLNDINVSLEPLKSTNELYEVQFKFIASMINTLSSEVFRSADDLRDYLSRCKASAEAHNFKEVLPALEKHIMDLSKKSKESKPSLSSSKH